jgi:hypothetical protein
MPTTHVVKQGECFTRVARRYGFTDYKIIYDHPSNAELKKKRPNPNVLWPGDKINIPDKVEKLIDCATGARHVFKMKTARKVLRIVLKEHDGAPLSGAAYVLEVGNEVRNGMTDGDGLLTEKVPIDVPGATLTVAERVLHLSLGHLNPIGDEEEEKTDCSGIQGRLKNLGYDVGRIDGKLGRRTRAALAVFQSDHDLDIDGEPGRSTLDKLEQAHGS